MQARRRAVRTPQFHAEPRPAAAAQGDTSLSIDDPVTLAHTAARAAADKLATDIMILDVGDLLGVTDHFVLTSARSERQLGTVAGEVEGQLKMAGERPRRREGSKESGWVLLDYGAVVVHCFTEEMRAYYSLERLWADAPSTTLEASTTAAAVSDR